MVLCVLNNLNLFIISIKGQNSRINDNEKCGICKCADFAIGLSYQRDGFEPIWIAGFETVSVIPCFF